MRLNYVGEESFLILWLFIFGMEEDVVGHKWEGDDVVL